MFGGGVWEATGQGVRAGAGMGQGIVTGAGTRTSPVSYRHNLLVSYIKLVLYIKYIILYILMIKLVENGKQVLHMKTPVTIFIFQQLKLFLGGKVMPIVTFFYIQESN